MIGVLEKITAFDLWDDPAEELLSWIERNPEYISELIGFDFTKYKREKQSGGASVIFRGSEGDIMPVLGQFKEQGLESIGRLISCLSLYNAKKAIWVSSNPSGEDYRTVDWLNSIGFSITFLKIEFVKIGESMPAPMLSELIKPEQKSAQKKARVNIGQYKEFWFYMAQKLKNQTGVLKTFAADNTERISMPTGKPGITWSFFITKNKGSAELNFEYGWNLDKEIVYLLRRIFREKEKIENKLGAPLVWEEGEEKGVSRIRSFCTLGGLDNKDLWNEIRTDLIDRQKSMEAALRNYL